MSRRGRWLGVAALAVALAASGLAGYLLLDDEDPEPEPAPSTRTVPELSEAQVAAAVTGALSDRLPVPLNDADAACLGERLLAELSADELAALAQARDPAQQVSPQVRDRLVAAVVICLPEDQAAALLADG